MASLEKKEVRMKMEDTKTIREDKEQRRSIWEVLIGIVKKNHLSKEGQSGKPGNASAVSAH